MLQIDWPVVNRPPVYKPVIRFLNWLPHFQLLVVLFRNQPKQFESWLNDLQASQIAWKLASLPNEQPVAWTTWKLTELFTQGYKPNKDRISKIVSQVRHNQCQRGSDTENDLWWCWLSLASFPGPIPSPRGEAWYTLFAHARNIPSL